jgi:UDP-glucose 4-epimerase
VARALVTGGAGFIGAHLTARLVERGFEVVALDDLSWGNAHKLDGLKGVRLIEGDIRKLPQLGPLGAFSHVFHLAALISAYQSLEEPDQYFDTNVNGLLRVLELCKGSERPRLVFASTSGVYGNSEQALKSEGDVPRPTTVYAATKLAGEHLLAMYRERLGFDDVALRFFNVYGPGQSTKHPYANVTCRFSHAAAHGGTVQLYGDGSVTRDFIYIDDVVDAILTVAFKPTQQRVYNVGTGRAASIGELLATVQRLAIKPITVERHAAWPNDIQSIRANMSRLEQELGFKARVGFEQGLKQTIEYFASSASAT